MPDLRPEISIRTAEPVDAVSLCELAARTYFETFASVNTAENMAAYMLAAFTPEQFDTELKDSCGVFYVAEAGGVMIGYAKLMWGEAPTCVTGEAPVELVRFYVDRPWHGSGVATALMAHVIEEARWRNAKTLYLGVWEKNFRAQAFYRKWSFVRVGDRIFQMGDDAQTDWWMARNI